MQLLLLLLLLAGISVFGFYITKRVGERLLPKIEYKGDYVQQSFVSVVTVIVLVILFFTLAHEMTYDNCALSWSRSQCYTYYDYFMFHLDMSWYEFILVPSITLIFITEFFLRTILKKNHILYSILNTFFLSTLPLLISYIISNISIGA